MSAAKMLDDKILKKLSEPFPADKVGVMPGRLSGDRRFAFLVLYLQHTDVYARIESVDPAWSAEITGAHVLGDRVYVRAKVTILGVSRENFGEGTDYKAAASDAIKRAAMLFGVGRYLRDSEEACVEYVESRDKYRAWTKDDYDGALRRGQPQVPNGADEPPRIAAGGPKRTKAELERAIFALAEELQVSRPELFRWAEEVTGKSPAKMATADLEKFLDVLESEKGRNGVGFGG